MEEVKNYYPLEVHASVDAVVVHCSDPRFQEAFRRFVREELGVIHPAPITIPGSVSSVGTELLIPAHLKTLKGQIEFMMKHSKEPRLILINHEDCKMYESLHTKIAHALLHKKQAVDLVKAAALLKRIMPHLPAISVYMARIDNTRPEKERVYFEKLM